MKVRSVRFGTVEVPDDRIVQLARPFLGFEQLRCFAFIEDGESAPVFWMQSLEAPEVLFPVVDACMVADDYALDLADPEVGALGLEKVEDARLLCVLTLSADPAAITANLRAPIVWNTRQATAMQVVRQDREFPIAHPVAAAAAARRSNKEVACARSHTPQG